MYGIITKVDLLKDKVQDVKIIERELSEHLGVGGAEDKIFSTSLYNKDVTPGMKRDRDIDKTMCLIIQTIYSYKGHQDTGRKFKLFNI